METIAFYSYKGGVGRTLLLANAARFLAMLGKRVVAVDLDLEAPGLHYKLPVLRDEDGKAMFAGGAVPYLVATAEGSTNGPPLAEHLIDIPVPPESGGWLKLMPAGPAPDRAYWKALKQLGERLHLDDPTGKGLMAVLDLRARILDELKPHYLLIDARTGVTELGGLATTILADTVVCLFAANQESVDGTLTVVEALKAAKRLPGQEEIRVVPVLARAISTDTKQAIFDRVQRLVAHAEVGSKVEVPGLFVLPHDPVHGAGDAVVAGDRTASAYSPLHAASLDLFRFLFPTVRSEAVRVMRRVEALARIRKELLDDFQGPEPKSRAFPPWREQDILEGCLIDVGKGPPRYADMVCYDNSHHPIMVIEYLDGRSTDELASAWSGLLVEGLRCLVLVDLSEDGRVTTTLFTTKSEHPQLSPFSRKGLPRPREFELIKDLSNTSIQTLVRLLHSGHADYIEGLVEHWQHSVAVTSTGGFGWHPSEAREILDGLSTVEGEVAVQVLTHVAPNQSREWLPYMGGMGADIERWTTEGLFAPLFWRLPVEAVVAFQQSPRRELPSLAGHHLFAQDLMGLRFEPHWDYRREADELARRGERDNLRSMGSGQRLFHDTGHLWQMVHLRYGQKNVSPAAIIQDGFLATSEWRAEAWSEDRSRGRAIEWAHNLCHDSNRLTGWLGNLCVNQEVIANGLLGTYDPSTGTLSLHMPVLDALAPLLGLKPRYLKSVAFIHLSVLAYAHQARDLDGNPGYGFAVSPPTNPFHRDNPVHVIIAQYFTFKLIERLEDDNLMAAFDKLTDHQPEPHRRWRRMRTVPLERMRAVLMRARAAESAMDIPSDPTSA